jgi:CO/xanthine dehydrogenase Mo-binding subunit
VVDTDSISYNDVTGGSRVTFATGLAVHQAGEDIKAQMVARAAQMLSVDAADLVYEDGEVRSTKAADKRVSFKEIAAKSGHTGGPIVGKGATQARGVGAAFGTHIADVEVDPETGKVTVLRYTVVQDVGTAVHPSYVEGQMQGGAAQGIGWALNEEYYYGEDGRMQNASYLDYRMPTALDLPMIETVLVEVPNPGHPFGVRGVGEVPIVPPLAAVANAVADATGHRFYNLPMSPRRIVEELHHLK